MNEEMEKWEVGQFWNGYCPECWLKGKRERMRLNSFDFFECEKSGLQIMLFVTGVAGIILKFRGKGKFRIKPEYAHENEIMRNEILCPQTLSDFPFSTMGSSKIFNKSEEIEKYINEEVEKPIINEEIVKPINTFIVELKKSIDKIGSRLVKCKLNCNGINCNIEEGFIPRCLVLEDGNPNEKGCAIIGINPGHANKKELEYYKKNGSTYNVYVDYWNEKLSKLHYHKSLRNLARNLDFNGPILWTELVKCENSSEEHPPLQTFRTCVDNYLTEELKHIPDDWVLIAVSREAYNALAYLYPKRNVIGVPHPRSRNNNFSKLLNENKELNNDHQTKINDLNSGKKGFVIWLGEKNSD
jgi:hypothetical protein